MARPVDYSKWTHIEDADHECSSDDGRSKEWSQMDAEERRLVVERADRDEKRIQNNHKVREAWLRRIDKDLEMEDDAWMWDVDMDSYEDFTIKRVARVIKTKGADFFKRGDWVMAEQQWLGGLELVKKVGMSWPTASELYVQLKCNLTQMYIKQGRWNDAKTFVASALDVDPGNEKALFRSATVHVHFAEWLDGKRYLELLLRKYPQNREASRLLGEVRETLQNSRLSLRSAGVQVSNAVQDLTPDGTLRKVRVLTAGEECPDDIRWMWPWGRDEWLGASQEKPVLSLHIVVRSVAGEELFTTRARTHLPETPEERNQMRHVMREVAQLDDAAGKQPRTPADFLRKEDCRHPMRWRYGDPTIFKGFELAARSMMLKEKAVFDIDQPLLEPSVCEFYKADGGVARVAGLPSFKHYIEERKLSLLAEELPEWELDLENKTQRTVRVEMELSSIQLYRDLSSGKTGEYLLHVAFVGERNGALLQQGLKVSGDFTIAGALSGSSLYAVERAIWILGNEGQQSEKEGVCYDTVWIPKCVGQAIRDAGFGLREGAALEARLQAGPTPWQMNPEKARMYDWKRATEHRPPVSISIKIHGLYR